MTQKTKLEIIGPYTPEHEGPHCTRGGRKARIICVDRAGAFPTIALVEDGEGESLHMYSRSGSHHSRTSCSTDLTNASVFRANLCGTHFTSPFMTDPEHEVKGWTPDQLEGACAWDVTTKWPDGHEPSEPSKTAPEGTPLGRVAKPRN